MIRSYHLDLYLDGKVSKKNKTKAHSDHCQTFYCPKVDEQSEVIVLECTNNTLDVLSRSYVVLSLKHKTKIQSHDR